MPVLGTQAGKDRSKPDLTEVAMTRLSKSALLSAVMTVAGATAGQAQDSGACMWHEDAVAELKQTYGEEKVGLGLGPSGSAVFELFLAETGTWTLLVTRTDGISCVAASGDNWMTSPLLAGDPI
jgi:hypothetical protein